MGPQLFDTNAVPVSDDSGNGTTGTVYGATWVTNGITGGGYEFDGSDDYIAASTCVISNPTAFTLTYWFYKHSGNNYQFGWSGDPLGENIPRLENTDSFLRFNFYPTKNEKIDSASIVSNSVWFFVTFSYDGTTLKSYINADNLTTAEYPGDHLPTWSSVLKIGAGHQPGGQYFDGVIDEFRMYDRALTADEIQELYYHDAHMTAGTVTFEAGVQYVKPLGDVTMGVYTNQ